MQSVTVASVMAGARRAADDRDDALADDPTIIALINTHYQRLYAIYLKAWPESFRATEDITTDGTADYDLPEDHFATIGVDWVEASGLVHELRVLHEHERNLFSGNPTGSRAERYRVIGDTVVLFPTPPTGQTYRHIYIPVPATLDDDADEIDVRLGHDRFLHLLVARDLLNQEESYDGRHDGEIKRLEEEIMEEAEMRLLYEPHRMAARRRGIYDPADYPRRGR